VGEELEDKWGGDLGETEGGGEGGGASGVIGAGSDKRG